MVVDVGCTVVEPTSVLVLKFPGVIATDDAFDTFQESVDVPAEATMEDDAVKEVTVGAAPLVVARPSWPCQISGDVVVASFTHPIKVLFLAS